MKYLFTLSLVLSFALGTIAQTTTDAQNYTQQLTQRYQLDKSQSAKVLELQSRKQKNLIEIAALQNTNPNLYLKKKMGINKNTLANFQKLLTNDQLAIFKSDQAAFEKKRSAKIAKLKEEGLKAEAIQLAISDMRLLE